MSAIPIETTAPINATEDSYCTMDLTTHYTDLKLARPKSEE